jgi:hypothetical protein
VELLVMHDLSNTSAPPTPALSDATDLDVTDLDVTVSLVRSHIYEGDQAKKEADKHYVAAGQYLAELKRDHTDGSWTEWEALLKTKVGISTGRASELMQIADGRKTTKEVRASTAKRVAKHREKKSSLRNEDAADAAKSEPPKPPPHTSNVVPLRPADSSTAGENAAVAPAAKTTAAKPITTAAKPRIEMSTGDTACVNSIVNDARNALGQLLGWEEMYPGVLADQLSHPNDTRLVELMRRVLDAVAKTERSPDVD